MHKNSMKLNHHVNNDSKIEDNLLNIKSPIPLIDDSTTEDDENKENNQITLYDDKQFSVIYGDYDINEGMAENLKFEKELKSVTSFPLI